MLSPAAKQALADWLEEDALDLAAIALAVGIVAAVLWPVIRGRK